MLHAVKPMIWQALQTLRDAKQPKDCVRRTQLKVLSHNLSAEGKLPQLVTSFDEYFPAEVEEVECKEYLETLIHDAVRSLQEANKETEMKVCVERVHHVCWELCRVQVKQANEDKFPELLTEASTKIWWKIFNSFSETDCDTDKTLYPVVMDWEEVDYWANVLLKLMALPTVAASRSERSVMGSAGLNFQDSLVRLNQRLNHDNSMYVRDQEGRPDVLYIQQALAELNTKLFEGIYLSGMLGKVKRGGSSSAKWCVLYSLGLGFADSPAEVDKSSDKTFLPITASTVIEHKADKSGRPVRFQLRSANNQVHHEFDANNISTRNKWVAAIICIKNSTAPDYLRDSIARRKNRVKNRQLEAEAKETLLKQREETRRRVEELSSKMQEEKHRFKEESERLRSASKEELQLKVSEYEAKLGDLMEQMHRLSESHEQEKRAIEAQHEADLQEQRHKLEAQHTAVQSQLSADLLAKTEQINALQQQLDQQQQEMQRLVGQMEQQQAEAAERIKQLEAENAELRRRVQELLEQLRQQSESHERHAAELKNEIKQLQDELQRVKDQLQQQGKQAEEKASLLEAKIAELQQQLQAAAEQQHQQKDSSAAEVRQLQEKQKELEQTVTVANSERKRLENQLAALQQSSKSHRGPGFDAVFKN